MTFADFILAHSADDPAALALSRGRCSAFPEFSLALSTLEARRKLRGKVPQWLEHPSLRFPLPLSAEQCSSTETALYKAHILASLFREERCYLKPSLRDPSQKRPLPLCISPCSPPRGHIALRAAAEGGHGFQIAPLFPAGINLADLTGGLGVDAWAFATAGATVLYNDMKPELEEAARHNFAELGVDVECRCEELKQGAVSAILDGFKPDAFFLDPARRSATGGKVFRISDCSPDVTALLPELFAAARYVLVKLSPMLDITLGARELGPCVREVHVVGSGGECKEILFLLDSDHSGDYTVTVYDSGHTLSFTPSEEHSAIPLLTQPSEARGETYLFEPGKALLKAGCFKLLSQRYGIQKAGVNTHLYFSDTHLENLSPFGKWFRILETAPLDKRSIKSFGERYPGADVTARDVHMTSEELLKRLRSSKSASTGISAPADTHSSTDSPVHIFALSTPTGNLLLACTK